MRLPDIEASRASRGDRRLLGLLLMVGTIVAAAVTMPDLVTLARRPAGLDLFTLLIAASFPLWVPWLLLVSVRLVRGQALQLFGPVGLTIVGFACLVGGIWYALAAPMSGVQARVVGVLLVAGVGSLLLGWQRWRRHAS